MLEPDVNQIERHLTQLVGERNPHSSLDRLHQAGRYISEQFHSLGLEVEEETVPFEGTESKNILARKRGSPAHESMFLLVAHYDTVMGTPGADDNASAVAALLEVARCLNPVAGNLPILFAAFTLEEYGFIGCRHFIEQSGRRKETILGMISLEMVGYRNCLAGSQQYPPYLDPSAYPDTGDFIAVVGNEPSARLTATVAESIRQTVPSLPVESLVVPGRGDEFTEVRLSDHSPFWEIGTPAVMITDTAFFRNPNYHQPTDTLDTLDLEFIRDVAQGVAGFLRHIPKTNS